MTRNINFQRKFPQTRLRRTRKYKWLRDLVAENNITSKDLIWPIFIIEGKNKEESIDSMPGVNRISIDKLVETAGRAQDLGIPLIAIFPAIEDSKKTTNGKEALNPNNLICRAVNTVKNKYPNLGIMCDVALDPYTSHGHDGILTGNDILNDQTLEILCKQAIIQAESGCDIIAPSDMMDGRIKAIRDSLDSAGHSEISILSYAAKYSSAFYEPFRDAIGSGKNLKGDKKTYQMNPSNSNEALHEVALDISEGADMVMIKPGLPYLDILQKIKESFNIPTFAYQVSGEYSMIMNAIEKKLFKKNEIIMENLISFKRAGADGIVTYFADQVAEILERNKM
ncbi:porphobilinogen synthase [Alphaproteobacteria bacterium]|nr:porphobilinogen synthase [Alphaproteobacteria bacterium]